MELPGGARLFVPEPLLRAPGDGRLDLTLHLHGGHESVQRSFVRSQRRGALITLILPGLSAIYTKHFAENPGRILQMLLDSAAKELGVPGFGSVWVSSFSAGFGGVRVLLRDPVAYDRIDALVLADTLYAGFEKPIAAEGRRPAPDPSNLRNFVRFARDAASGRKAMLVTHSALIPPTYSSTEETADALLEAVEDLRRETVREAWPESLTLATRARRGRFAVYGFTGDDGPAHLRHLAGLWMFYRLVPRI